MSVVYLLGRPVSHSLSPAMHNAAFASLGLPHRYEPREVGPERLASVVDAMRREDVLGANVTIPHKVAALRLMDEVADEARRIGAVNTVVRRTSRLIGDNTDRYGFASALSEACGPLAHAKAVVLGAGGGARACVLELTEYCDVVVAGRTLERAEALVAALPRAEGTSLRAVAWTEAPRELATADVLVNATPIGLHGEDLLAELGVERVPPFAVDLVPTAEVTPLVRRAREAQDVCVVDGLLMLLHQAARSFRLWTGLEPPLAVMRAALPRPV